MSIIDTFLNSLKKITVSDKKSLVTRRFIIAISVIYAVLILTVSISFHYSMNASADILFDALISHNQEIIIDKIGTLIERLHDKHAATKEDIQKEIENYNSAVGDILYVIMFAKTDDENYFRILHAIQLKNSLELNISKNTIIKENKKINYLRKGLLNSVVDPNIYSRDNHHWQNIYYPYQIKNRKIILQFLVSVSRTRDAIKHYNDSIRLIRLLNIVMTVVLALAVTALTAIFVQNYSLLIRNLSSYMKKAASGDLGVSLNPTSDDELNQLAQSFNTLMEELKDKTDKRISEAEGINTLFNTGVSILKENRLDEAIAIFKTLTIIKPQGFGSYFNLGVAYAKKREYDNALAVFEQALRINPSHELTRTYINKVRGLQNQDA
jgi:tetratricopeptide (TPR) repeat protein